MHPAEHRALRELYALTRQLREHWTALADRLEEGASDVAPLRAGAQAARELLHELSAMTAARELYGRPTAQGVGLQLAAARSGMLDHALEVNQALRLATLDAQHVVTLLAYLRRLADRRGDGELARFLGGWEERMRGHEEAARAAAIAVGDDPDAAIAPATPGLAGRVGHGLTAALGTFGEWWDRRAAR
ncbi:MAG: hypothetical protein M3296_02630 [Actinomycetota bacterium]|nr:hypothetical protein [Actinomycetota bacterium]